MQKLKENSTTGLKTAEMLRALSTAYWLTFSWQIR